MVTIANRLQETMLIITITILPLVGAAFPLVIATITITIPPLRLTAPPPAIFSQNIPSYTRMAMQLATRGKELILRIFDHVVQRRVCLAPISRGQLDQGPHCLQPWDAASARDQPGLHARDADDPFATIACEVGNLAQ